MAWCLADCSTTLLTVPGLEAPFHAMGGEGEIREEGQHSFHHVPVLSEEVIHYLAPEAGMTIVDATLGGAGQKTPWYDVRIRPSAA